MKSWLILAAACIAALAGLVYFTPLNQVVYDPPPAPAAMAETVVIDRPMPALPQPKPAPEPAARLGRQLVIREPVPAAVSQGAVMLPPGMPVELAKDNGTTVDVKFGEKKQATTAAVPRSAVANRDELPPLPVSTGAIETVRQSVTGLGHAPASSIAIEAKEVGTGFGGVRSYESSIGRTDQSVFRTKGLAVTVRNLSRRPTGELDINVYWTGRRLADNQLHITHGETFRANVDGVSEHSETSWCPLLDSQVTTYDWTNVRRTSGSKFDGWFVVVTRDNQLLVGRGATETYNSIIRDSAQLQPLLATWSGSGLHATESRPLWRHERPGQTAAPHERPHATPQE
ncbi:MAG TPA: hypothetical protein VEO95_05275 [Chthoniobacteraceae bacterium]|nr:hypothetical protein [Chthoniobacteraceae bacterium]